MKRAKFMKYALYLWLCLFVSLTVAHADSIESQIMQIREIHQSGNLQKAAFMKRALLSKLPQDYYRVENKDDINFLMDYVVDEYVIACASIAQGTSKDQELDVKEYLLQNELDEDKLQSNLNSTYKKYGKLISDNIDVLEPTIRELFKDKKLPSSSIRAALLLSAGSASALGLSGALAGSGALASSVAGYVGAHLASSALSPAIVTIPVALRGGWKLYKNDQEKHELLQNTLNRLTLFAGARNARLSPAWENAMLSYKKLFERATLFNANQKKILEALATTAQADFLFELESMQNKRETILYNLDQNMRSYLFDWGCTILCYKSQFEVMDAKGIVWDDDDKIQESGLFFSKYTKFLGYCVLDTTKKLTVETMKLYKSELSKKRYEELVSTSRLLVDPLGLPQKIEVAWP